MIPDRPLQVKQKIRDFGVIAIIRGNFAADILPPITDALVKGGVRIVEVTLNSPDALKGIAELRRRYGHKVLIGAGTVRMAADIEGVLNAGAQFLISPHFNEEIVVRADRANVLYLPGIFTATEAQAAYFTGCTMVKLFPAATGGPEHLKALRAPLDNIGFVPTGGINESNLAAYVRAGAVAVGLGGALVTGPEQDLNELAQRAARFVSILKQARETSTHA